MEELPFIKCEPPSLSDMEKPCDIMLQKLDYCDQVMIKVEPEGGEEEHCAELTKEEHGIQDAADESHQDNKEIHPLFSTLADGQGHGQEGTTGALLNEHILHHFTEKQSSSSLCNSSEDNEKRVANLCSVDQQSNKCSLIRGKKKFKCFECGQIYRRQIDLKTHMFKHKGEKPFKCDNCVKTFCHPTSLRIHQLVHTGVKRLFCDYCGRGFAFKSCLRDHVLSHTGVKLYECMICSRPFSNQSNLNAHVRTHTGERPHVCHLCNRGFAHSSTLRKHIITHARKKT